MDRRGKGINFSYHIKLQAHNILQYFVVGFSIGYAVLCYVVFRLKFLLTGKD